ncbi:Tryptophan--tRNA ligase [compost metagenome]
MAADILMFNAHKVPVGRDQIQHVEMARDIGQRFNHLFGQGKEFFTMPEALIEESVATLPGLDGRKMSKSYDNTIPLYSSAKDMKKAISRIVTDSLAPGEAKDPDSSHLFTLFQAFSTPVQTKEFRSELLQGLGWGEAKSRLFELLDNELGESRERYHQLIERPSDLEDILQHGAKKARAVATPFLNELREAVGLRSFVSQVQVAKGTKKKVAKAARFVSFRDEDGSFRFRFLSAGGQQLFLSRPFKDAKDAGIIVKSLQKLNALDIGREEPLSSEGPFVFVVWGGNQIVADSPEYSSTAERDIAISELQSEFKSSKSESA